MHSRTGPTCDVIILTALRIEFQAVHSHLKKSREITHPEGTIYQYGTFQSEQRTWQVALVEIGMGGQRAALETERALNFFQPELAFFVGIAGGLKDVELGDVVVASKIYGYEAGKAGHQFQPRPEVWHADDALMHRARAEARETRWLARLGPVQPIPAPRVFVAPLAAGEKVVASRHADTYRLLQETYQDALAVEMEGHGFSQAVHAHFSVRGLVIRGISDLIEQKIEADASGSQERAAYYAAAFAFEVLAHFTLPPTLPQIWMVPFERNRLFTGREDLLRKLHEQLHHHHMITLSQRQAISGLGGIGKTQLAIEYIYRHYQEYRTILWAYANSTEALSSSYVAFAEKLGLPEYHEQNQLLIIQAVKNWLQENSGWLLIWDNADEPDILHAFLPNNASGHLILTTRAATLSPQFAQHLELPVFLPEQGALLLLRRAGYLAPEEALEQATLSDQMLAIQISEELGGLPLAIDQAGAYIFRATCGLAHYLQIYQQRHDELLKQEQDKPFDYPYTVATTWLINFQQVEKRNPAAADLLRFCSFLDPNNIPEELLSVGAHANILNDPLAQLGTDAMQLDLAVGALRDYALIQRNPKTLTLSMHRLVQTAQRNNMPIDIQLQWIQRAVYTLDAACPGTNFADWPAFERLLPHVLTSTIWINQKSLATPIVAHLLNQTGYYLKERVRYREAEPLLKQALTLREHLLGNTHVDTAFSLNDLAELYYAQGEYEKAESLFKQALAIREHLLGLSHLDTAASLNNLAELYRTQGRYEEAEPLYLRTLKIFEQQLDASHLDISTNLNNLALLYTSQGKHEQAKPLYLRALAIREQLLGSEHPDTATSLNNLAESYRIQGNYEEAEPLSLRALAIRELALGTSHPATATVLNNLALIYKNQGKYEKAEPLFRRTLTIKEQRLGPEHPDTATSLNNLAELYRIQRNYEEAEPLYVRALAIRELALGTSHPSTANIFNNLAELYRAEEKYEKAVPLYVRALTIRKQRLGNQHPQTRTLLANYVSLLKTMGRDEEAKKLEEE